MADTEDRPVLSGLLALVAVAVVVGLLAGLAVLFGTKMLGLDGDVAASSEASSRNTLYLPEPEPTETTSSGSATEAQSSPTETEVAKEIALAATQQSVSPMQQIDLTGTYPQGEGAILQVQRLEDGRWVDFPVTMSVSNQTFATYVQTGRTGPNKFRVIDTDSELFSNEVTVTVG